MRFTTEKPEEQEPVIVLALKPCEGGKVVLTGTSEGEIKDLMIFRSGGFYRPTFATLSGLRTSATGRIEELPIGERS